MSAEELNAQTEKIETLMCLVHISDGLGYF